MWNCESPSHSGTGLTEAVILMLPWIAQHVTSGQQRAKEGGERYMGTSQRSGLGEAYRYFHSHVIG